MVVVFPAPFGPRKPNTSPGLILRFKLLTAVSAPYFLVRLSALIKRIPPYRGPKFDIWISLAFLSVSTTDGYGSMANMISGKSGPRKILTYNIV